MHAKQTLVAWVPLSLHTSQYLDPRIAFGLGVIAAFTFPMKSLTTMYMAKLETLVSPSIGVT